MGVSASDSEYIQFGADILEIYEEMQASVYVPQTIFMEGFVAFQLVMVCTGRDHLVPENPRGAIFQREARACQSPLSAGGQAWAWGELGSSDSRPK